MVEHVFFEDPDELGRAAARLIASQVEASRAAGTSYLLGCPGGRTPKPIFDAMGALFDELDIDRSGMVIVMMDDYLDSSADPLQPVPADAHYSCRRFAEQDIRQVINGQAPASRSIPKESVWFPDPTDPQSFDDKIDAAGGIDLFLVASGASDGHVAFCGPGAAVDGRTSIVDLAPSTRVDNLATFPDFESADDVPTQGISIGLGTILRQSKSVMLVLHGHDKAESFARIETADGYDPTWPATFILEAENGSIWSDAATRRMTNGQGND